VDETAFGAYLKRAGKQPHIVARILAQVADAEAFARGRGAALLAEADVAVLEAFAADYGDRAKTWLWALGYYFEHVGRADLAARAGELREERTARARQALRLDQFMGVAANVLARLEAAGVGDVAQMRAAGATPAARAALAASTGLPLATVEELTRLADLSRLTGVRGTRARLYHDGGYPTLDALAAAEPQQVVDTLRAYVANIGFQGVAPWLSEATHSVQEARGLEREIEW
jgi:hypothetical protein